MGRLVLFIVLAAALGGSVLTVATRGTTRATSAAQTEAQADIMARKIAESGLGLAVSGMVSPTGLRDPNFNGAVELDGGEFTVSYTPTGVNEASLRVTGTYGGAIHEIENAYRYDPMHAPGPFWLDVPYGSGSIDGRLSIKGDRPVLFDPRRYQEHELGSFLPLERFTDMLSSEPRYHDGSRFQETTADGWTGPRGLLEDLSADDTITNTEDLYLQALSVFDENDGDTRMSGPVGPGGIASGRYWAMGVASWGGADKITIAEGGLRVSGSVSGSGLLVVDGDLAVDRGSSLRWEGLVLVRGTNDVLSLDLDGSVSIKGALAVVHRAFPPGGHLDVSVYRDPNGMTVPYGNRWGANSMWWGYPFFEHTHRFDQTGPSGPRGRHVYFLENGRAGRHESEVDFASLLDRLDSKTPVYLEFANAEAHGFSQFAVELAGSAGRIAGTVRGGFPGTFRSAAAGPHRSATFEVGDLRSLDVHVQSLRALQPMFDTESRRCSQWPICIGVDWDREDALAVRLMRASDNKRLYESTLYWHMRGDEAEAYEAAEDQWRREIQDGKTFGTHLDIDGKVTLDYRSAPIAALAEKMEFDGNQLVLVTAAADHTRPSEAAREEPSGPVVCHRGKTETFSMEKYLDHRDHTTLGPCKKNPKKSDDDD